MNSIYSSSESINVKNGVAYNHGTGTLTEQLNWLNSSIKSGQTYLIEVDKDESLNPFVFPNGFANVNVIIRGVTPNLPNTTSRMPFPPPTLQLSQNGNMFRIENGITLILENVVLRGRDGNNMALVRIMNGATLKMGHRASIEGNENTVTNTNQPQQGGGILVDAGGILQMDTGSSVAGNKVPNRDGGGVYCFGQMIVNGGVISNNGAMNGGGVFAASNSMVSFRSGMFKNNTATGNGGSVYLMATSSFDMHGGIISGSSANIGGGVSNAGLFRISNGIVYGAGSAEELRNMANEGASLQNIENGEAFYGTFNSNGEFTSLQTYTGN